MPGESVGGPAAVGVDVARTHPECERGHVHAECALTLFRLLPVLVQSGN